MTETNITIENIPTPWGYIKPGHTVAGEKGTERVIEKIQAVRSNPTCRPPSEKATEALLAKFRDLAATGALSPKKFEEMLKRLDCRQATIHFTNGAKVALKSLFQFRGYILQGHRVPTFEDFDIVDYFRTGCDTRHDFCALNIFPKTNPKEDEPMSTEPTPAAFFTGELPYKEVTLVCNNPLDQYTADSAIAAIEELRKQKERLEGITTESKAIKNHIKNIDKAIAALVGRLDEVLESAA